jgi:hypothetical protein
MAAKTISHLRTGRLGFRRAFLSGVWDDRAFTKLEPSVTVQSLKIILRGWHGKWMIVGNRTLCRTW